jgi:uncharacterized protein (TIGR03790 family)
VNDQSPASVEIGEYYAQRRSIPEGNVCRIDTPAQEEIDRVTYRTRVEEPIAACLKERKLVEKTSYLVTTLGVPLKVRGSEGQNGTQASVDSELTLLYGRLRGGGFDLAGMEANPLFGVRDAEFSHARFPIYLVTRLAAYSVESVKAMIDRAIAARNIGRVVLDLSSGEDRTGNDWLRSAAILIQEDRLTIEESPDVLYGQKQVIGYASWGGNDSHRKRRHLGFEWLPGAIATEYVSTNGRTFERPPEDWAFGTWEDRSSWFGGSPQSLTADLIEEGATGASGHVYEPYLTAAPRPEYLFPAYLSGKNLAESYYRSIPGLSWMNIVIGDPLCRLE